MQMKACVFQLIRDLYLSINSSVLLKALIVVKPYNDSFIIYIKYYYYYYYSPYLQKIDDRTLSDALQSSEFPVALNINLVNLKDYDKNQ